MVDSQIGKTLQLLISSDKCYNSCSQESENKAQNTNEDLLAIIVWLEHGQVVSLLLCIWNKSGLMIGFHP